MIHRIRPAKIDVPLGYITDTDSIFASSHISGRANTCFEGTPAVSSVANGYLASSTFSGADNQEVFLRFFNLLIGVEGDADSQLSSWVVQSRYQYLYWKLTDVAGTRTVKLYSDSGGTTEVSTGSRVGDGSITLNQTGGTSGVSGSVTVAYVKDDTDTANNRLIFSNGRRISRMLCATNVSQEVTFTAMDTDWAETITWATRPTPSGTQIAFGTSALSTPIALAIGCFMFDDLPDPCYGLAARTTVAITGGGAIWAEYLLEK